MGSSSKFPPNQELPDKLCDQCGAPSSRANISKRNLTWGDNLRLHITSYNLSPRMWPLGYILSSPYSPFYLEKQMPDREWRDAFEDLLALESGGQMVSHRSRNQQNEVMARARFTKAAKAVDFVNWRLKWNESMESELRKSWDMAKMNGQPQQQLDAHDKVMANIRKEREELLVAGKHIIELHERSDNSSTARKMERTQWIASLIFSGALRGWKSLLWDSAQGLGMNFTKETSGINDPEQHDSISLTEEELHKQFERGIPMTLGSPEWTTANGHYPFVADNSTIDQGEGSSSPRSIQIPVSIARQYTRADRTKEPNGTTSMKLISTNHFTNGKLEVKEITDSAAALEEAEEARLALSGNIMSFIQIQKEASLKGFRDSIPGDDDDEEDD